MRSGTGSSDFSRRRVECADFSLPASRAADSIDLAEIIVPGEKSGGVKSCLTLWREQVKTHFILTLSIQR